MKKKKSNVIRTKNPKICIVFGQGSRSSQQDSFAVEYGGAGNDTVALVADGMGGLVNSSEVSNTITSCIRSSYAPSPETPPMELLFSLCKKAIASVGELIKDNTYSSGSTLCSCIIRDNMLHWLSIGDSRLYLCRGDGLIQLTRDHDFFRELAYSSLTPSVSLADVYSNPQKGALTSYVGKSFPQYADFNEEPVLLKKKDVVLLLSDGVYRCLSQEELCRCLKKSPRKAAKRIDRLIQKKNIKTQDNYTAIIISL